MPATPTRTRRPLVLAAAVATAATIGTTALALAGATSAAAAEVPLSGYELTWGIKQSYRSYVTGMAAGTFTATDGAAQAADNGAFTFTEGTGTYDSTAHTVALGFQGTLNIKSDLHRFEITLSDVRFDSADAAITADVTKSGTTTQDVPLADVTVTQSMTDMETKLTKEAADVFGSASYEGAAGDPLTVVKTTPTPTPTPTPTVTTTPTPTVSESSSSSPSSPSSPSSSSSPSPSSSDSATVGDIADGTLGWGVKESFRTYVVGGVAKGSITTSDGASQAADNGIFTFVDATGEYDADAGSLAAAFEGAVNFKGHEENGEYGLDLTLSDVKVSLEDGKGELTADVTSLGEKSEDVTLADLKAASASLTEKDDVVEVDDVTATLTEAGADAFSGYYTAGTELDPVDLAVALTDDATLPTDDESSTPASTPGGTTTGGVAGSLADTGSDVPVGALGAAAAVTVAAGAGVVFAMRRRRTEV